LLEACDLGFDVVQGLCGNCGDNLIADTYQASAGALLLANDRANVIRYSGYAHDLGGVVGS
jgi:hypothetical protein